MTPHRSPGRDWRVRLGALRWLRDRCRILGRDVLHYSELAQCQVEGEKVALRSQRGILRPRQCRYPLTITTSPKNPYGDHFDPGTDLLRYRYQGDGWTGRLRATENSDNQGLKDLIRLRWPVAYLHGVTSGQYLVVAPVVIVDDDPVTQTFGVCLGAGLFAYEGLGDVSGAALGQPLDLPWQFDRQRYDAGVARLVRHNEFKARVLAAYRFRCAVCHSDESPLIEAARIAPRTRQIRLDVRDGIAMCPSHRTAFDRLLIGIAPDHEIRVRPDFLRRARTAGTASPNSLLHVHGTRLWLPADPAQRPRADALSERFGDFEFSARLNP